ncbi:hypothetical protein TNIN_341651 [Trichonephila inaurata madagascariensis]|uniref:Uncharacterized protein n=1 Tax=Trichonephila inaurata madagascariensis TaxID=2747483 RepID=A0A8X7CHN1_9ARAC|nr:hypothetical protein TNIN_341651 [Trichonephila inaurata madagascariensis]
MLLIQKRNNFFGIRFKGKEIFSRFLFICKEETLRCDLAPNLNPLYTSDNPREWFYCMNALSIEYTFQETRLIENPISTSVKSLELHDKLGLF